MSSHEDAQQQEGGASKIRKRFENNTKRLEQILAGDTSAYSTKVPSAGVPALMAKLIADRREAAEKRFLTEMADLLDKKVAFDKEIKNMERELQKAIEKKMEEFNKEMERVFNIIERVDQTAHEYADAMKTDAPAGTGGEDYGPGTAEEGKEQKDEDLAQ